MHSWAGKDTSDASQFYNSKSVVQMYKDYISVVLNHVNKYTGVSTIYLCAPCQTVVHGADSSFVFCSGTPRRRSYDSR